MSLRLAWSRTSEPPPATPTVPEADGGDGGGNATLDPTATQNRSRSPVASSRTGRRTLPLHGSARPTPAAIEAAALGTTLPELPRDFRASTRSDRLANRDASGPTPGAINFDIGSYDDGMNIDADLDTTSTRKLQPLSGVNATKVSRRVNKLLAGLTSSMKSVARTLERIEKLEGISSCLESKVLPQPRKKFTVPFESGSLEDTCPIMHPIVKSGFKLSIEHGGKSHREVLEFPYRAHSMQRSQIELGYAKLHNNLNITMNNFDKYKRDCLAATTDMCNNMNSLGLSL